MEYYLTEFMAQENTNYTAGTNINILEMCFRIRIVINSKSFFHLKY